MQIIRGAVIAKLLLQFYNATISEMCFVKNQNIFNNVVWSHSNTVSTLYVHLITNVVLCRFDNIILKRNYIGMRIGDSPN